ncbi:hypothetical protein [Nonomuraea rubra]|uniref:hypothetical protein n=1 Tax=Nonomuraea rubra TaxID=46180 RepID=UPI0033EABAEC
MWAALAVNAGASATVIGTAAGMSRVAASKILNQLEAEGRARREAGGRDGQGRGRTPDQWYPVTADPVGADDTDSLPVSASDQAPDVTGLPETDKGGDSAAPDEPVEEIGDGTAGLDEEPDGDAALALVASPDGENSDAGTSSSDAPSQAAEEPEIDSSPTVARDADEKTGDEGAGEPDAEPVILPEADSARAQARAELIELANLIMGAASAMDGDEDAVLALGRLEMAMAKAPQAHRIARAVLTGIDPAPARSGSGRIGARSGGTAGAVRHGGLRDRVLNHLTEHPGKDFTPYEIGRVLDASSGAVANALDRLVGLGQAELTCERPRRFALADSATSGD